MKSSRIKDREELLQTIQLLTFRKNQTKLQYQRGLTTFRKYREAANILRAYKMHFRQVEKAPKRR